MKQGTRPKVRARDKDICVAQGPFCLGEYQVLHHRANRGSGGAGTVLDEASNLVVCCSPCNSWIEDSHGEDREDLIRRGLRVKPGRTHAHTAEKVRTTPVQYLDGRFYLDNQGGRSTELPY